MRTVLVAVMVTGIALWVTPAARVIAPAAPPPKPQPQPLTIDSFGDGMPDAMRLDTATDRERFRRWFAFLAEMQFYEPSSAAIKEVNDCAALVRYAYHEALQRHTSEWRRQFAAPIDFAVDDVEKYSYPRTPLGAAIFRTRDGGFREFADAESLVRYNTHAVGRSLDAARKADLLVFHQPGQKQPYHVMIFIGASELTAGPENDWVVYHTGEDNGQPGTIKKVPLNVLRAHPSARWRPVPQNENFLGFYRWNILR